MYRSTARTLSTLVVALLLSGPAMAFETPARAAIIVDANTRATLYAKHPDEPIPPASMSKLMTAYLVFGELKAGRLDLADRLPVSEKAWRVTGSEMFVKIGERVAVEDLLRGMIVQSGNDACIVLAEALAGSEGAFAERMNVRARELGLTQSRFANATGLPDPQHRMSVRDLATLTWHLIDEFPEYYRYYAEREFTYAGIRQPNRNPLLQAGVPGVDGVKTGHTEEAGYGLVASAVRDGRRLIMVVAGLPSLRARRSEAEQLLEYAFRNFRHYELFAPGEAVAEATVWQGDAATVPLVANAGVSVSLSREARQGMAATVRYAGPVPAPIARGQRLGELEITAPDTDPVIVPLVAGREVAKAGVLGRIGGTVGYFLWGAS